MYFGRNIGKPPYNSYLLPFGLQTQHLTVKRMKLFLLIFHIYNHPFRLCFYFVKSTIPPALHPKVPFKTHEYYT